MSHPRQSLALLIMLALLACLTACGPEASNETSASGHPWLSGLDAGDEVKTSGKRLMALADGLHPLEQPGAGQEAPESMLVGVHGYASEGYEWVYPLKTMDDNATATFFYRWDYSRCPSIAADKLATPVLALAAEQGTASIRIIGHSLGGVLVSHLVSRDWPLPTEVHAIAAPLVGMADLNTRCGYEPPQVIGHNVRFYQWRTQHELDGAFSRLEIDPQIVSVPGMVVTTLPNDYNGHRLGHNWSISWVADELTQDH